MRSIWLIFGFLLLALLGLGFYLRRPAAAPSADRAISAPLIVLASQRTNSAPAAASPADTLRAGIVRFALRQLGIPYLYAGSSPASGFDCSGFLQYVYGHFGVATPHSTALLIGAGQPVPRAQAQPGDLVVFTGTAEGSTTPGHAGIVISARGETPLRFVHASSARRESGVKISQVENSGYERRFMQVRRVLGTGTLAAVSAAAAPRAAAVRPPAAVPALPAAATRLEAMPAAPLPAKVTPVTVRPRPVIVHSQRAKTTRKASITAKRPTATKASARKPAGAQTTLRKAGKVRATKPVGQKVTKPATKSKAPLTHQRKA